MLGHFLLLLLLVEVLATMGRFAGLCLGGLGRHAKGYNFDWNCEAHPRLNLADSNIAIVFFRVGLITVYALPNEWLIFRVKLFNVNERSRLYHLILCFFALMDILDDV